MDKAPGAELASGTVNLNGSVEAEVVRPAGESTLARLVGLMEQAQTQKSRTESLTERWESPYAVIVLALVPAVYALLRFGFGLSVDDAWYRAMTFMVVASPCAVVISTPAVMLSAMAAAARRGAVQEQRRPGRPGGRADRGIRQDRHVDPGPHDPDRRARG